jgi:hypothetical protein
MGSWVNAHLEVLGSNTEEINQIERALQEPCDELIAWCVPRSGQNPLEMAADVQEIVSFKPIHNLGYVDPSVNKARRFEGSWPDKYWGLVWGHVFFVSRDFPTAVFLAEYRDDQMSYGGKIVIHAGEEIRTSHDGDHHAMGREWVLPNIFAPYQPSAISVLSAEACGMSGWRACAGNLRC